MLECFCAHECIHDAQLYNLPMLLYFLQLMFLPGNLSSLPKINSIHTEGLKLIDPPLFIAQEGFESMKMYMQHQASSSASWNFLRLMIVGPPSSGKSYLSARLRNVRYQNQPPTKGVQVTVFFYIACLLCTFTVD